MNRTNPRTLAFWPSPLLIVAGVLSLGAVPFTRWYYGFRPFHAGMSDKNPFQYIHDK